MGQSPEIRSITELLESALEASSSVLVTLESISLRIAEINAETTAAQAQVKSTIEAIRNAVSEALSLERRQTSVLSFGFILRGERNRPSEDHMSPRRTA